MGDAISYDNADVIVVGDLVHEGSVFSGFVDGACLYSNKTFRINAEEKPTFEWNVKFNIPTLSNDIRFFGNEASIATGIQGNNKFALWVCSNGGTTWDVLNAVVGTTTLVVNTDYEAKVTYDGTNYKVMLTKYTVADDGSVTKDEPIEDINKESALYPYMPEEEGKTIWGNYGETLTFGYNYKLDLAGCNFKVNDEIIWQGIKPGAMFSSKLYCGCKDRYKLPEINAYTVGTLVNNKGKLSNFTTANYSGIDPWDEGENNWEFVIGCDLQTTGNNTLIGNDTNTAAGGGFMLTTTSQELIFNGTSNGSSWTKATFSTGIKVPKNDPILVKVKRSTDDDETYKTHLLEFLNRIKEKLEGDTFDIAFGYAPAFTAVYFDKATYYRMKGQTNEEHQAEVQTEIDSLTELIDPLKEELATLNVDGLFTWNETTYEVDKFAMPEELTEDQQRALEVLESLNNYVTQQTEKQTFLTFIQQTNFYMFVDSTDNQTYPNYNTVALMKTGLQELHSHDTVNTLEVKTAEDYDKLLIDDENNTLLKTPAYKYSFHYAYMSAPDTWYDTAYFYSGNNMTPYKTQMRFGLTAAANPWQGNIYLDKAYIKIGEDIVWKGLKDISSENLETEINVTPNGALQSIGSELSGFKAAIYGIIPMIKTPTESLEWMLHFKSPTNVAYSLLEHKGSYKGIVLRVTAAGIVKLWMSSTGSGWDIANELTSKTAIPTLSDMRVRILWDGTTYTLDYKEDVEDEWTNLLSVEKELALNYETEGGQGIGGGDGTNFFNGGIYHMDGCYLNVDGERIWSGVNYRRDMITTNTTTINQVEITGNAKEEYVGDNTTIVEVYNEESIKKDTYKKIEDLLEQDNIYISDDGTDIDPGIDWVATSSVNSKIEENLPFVTDEIIESIVTSVKTSKKKGTLSCLGTNLVGTTAIYNGILTNMGTVNYAVLPFIFDVTDGSIWEWQFKFNTTSTGTSIIIGNREGNSGYDSFSSETNSNNVKVYNTSVMTAQDIMNGATGTTGTQIINQWHWVRVRYNGNCYYFDVSQDGKTWVRDFLLFNNKLINCAEEKALTLGADYNNTNRAMDYIDLKGCHFKKNGKYVWKGMSVKDEVPVSHINKLGDLYIEDNIISGFNTTQYMEIEYPNKPITSYKVEADFTAPTVSTGNATGNIFGCGRTDKHTPSIDLYGTTIRFWIPQADFTWVTGNTITYPYKYGSHYHVEINCTETTYTIKITEDGVAMELDEKATGEIIGIGWDQELRIGLGLNANPWHATGKLELDKIKATINGSVWADGSVFLTQWKKTEPAFKGTITKNLNYFINTNAGYWNLIAVPNNTVCKWIGNLTIDKAKYSEYLLEDIHTTKFNQELQEIINTKSIPEEECNLTGRFDTSLETTAAAQWTTATTTLNTDNIVKASGVVSAIGTALSGKTVTNFLYNTWYTPPVEANEELGTEAVPESGTWLIYLHYENNTVTTSDVELKGDVLDEAGILSGFSRTSYAIIPGTFPFDATRTSFEINFKFSVAELSNSIRFISSATNYVFAIGVSGSFISLYLGTGSSWDIANAKVGTTEISLNTNHTCKLTYDGSNYVLTLDSTEEINLASTKIPKFGTSSLWLGAGPTSAADFKMDLSGCNLKVDGEPIWQGRI